MIILCDVGVHSCSHRMWDSPTLVDLFWRNDVTPTSFFGFLVYLSSRSRLRYALHAFWGDPQCPTLNSSPVGSVHRFASWTLLEGSERLMHRLYFESWIVICPLSHLMINKAPGKRAQCFPEYIHAWAGMRWSCPNTLRKSYRGRENIGLYSSF